MADKRKGKKRKEENNGVVEEDKTTKDEYAVAKWLKKNVPLKKTKFLYHNVEYFTGSKAVDALLESKFAETLFPTRPDVIDYLDKMLRHKFFHRALKVPISEEELLQARKRRKRGDKDKEKEKEKTKESDAKDGDEAESSHAENRSEDPSASPKPTKEKKKRKVRLEMHIKQFFEDGLDAYVWIYDPIPLHYWIFGTFMVLGTVGICLFPLWPPEVRKGVYYLSIAGAGFLCLIIALAVLRLVVFCLLWCLSMGRHHLWLLPNLTEDVGFFASFWPLYHYEYKGVEAKEGKSKKKKKDKDSDNEQEDDKAETADDGEGEGDGDGGNEEPERGVEAEGTEVDERNSRSGSESESSSQKSQIGKDFEIVDKNDVEES